MNASDIKHHPSCSAAYPEKPVGEPPQHIQEMDLGDGNKVLVCTDCGAQVNNLPGPDDPYWDDVRDLSDCGFANKPKVRN